MSGKPIIFDGLVIDDHDEEGGAEFNDWAGEECGRWRNGKLGDVYYCLLAGTEFCDFECPLRDWEPE